ncbi:MAG: hypothetical protein WC574_06960 [Candidatus Omnitrophota bacterium]
MDTLISIAPLLGIFVAIFLTAMGVSWFSYKSGANRYLTPLLSLINGENKVPILGESSLKGTWEGKKVKITYAPASKYRTERIFIYFSCFMPLEATIYRKSFIDKVKDSFKSSFASENVNFDAKYVVRSNDDTKTRIFLNEQRREIVERIFNLITIGMERIPLLESAKDKQVLRMFEGNKSILELRPEQIVLKHYVIKVGLPPSDAVRIIFEGILKAMRELAG